MSTIVFTASTSFPSVTVVVFPAVLIVLTYSWDESTLTVIVVSKVLVMVRVITALVIP